MKLSHWAKNQGISYKTAHNWFRDNKLPVKSYQTKSGTIIVENTNVIDENKGLAIYTRVSSNDKKDDLKRQIERCQEFCFNKGFQVDKVFKEVASGMNDNRKELNKLLEIKYKYIVIEHKDRLTRFGFNYLETLLSRLGTEIIVINRDKEDETDLIKDFISIITSYCCRLYGMRRCKTKKEKILEVINDNH
jgi:putative resolvase